MATHTITTTNDAPPSGAPREAHQRASEVQVLRHYQREMMAYARTLGMSEVSETMHLVSDLADRIAAKSLSWNERILVVMTLAEAMVGTDRVADVGQDILCVAMVSEQ